MPILARTRLTAHRFGRMATNWCSRGARLQKHRKGSIFPCIRRVRVFPSIIRLFKEIAVRPHVELVQESDLCWHDAELVRGDGKVRQRNLSYDEEDGSASTRLIFDSAWHRPGGYHHADIEWYVMQGTIKVGERMLGKGGYYRAPAGLRVPEMSVQEGTEVLVSANTATGVSPSPTRIVQTLFRAAGIRGRASRAR